MQQVTGGEKPLDIPINASKNSGLQNLFVSRAVRPAPGPQEALLYKEATGRDPVVDINASAGGGPVEVQLPPDHQYSHLYPNSLKRHPQGKFVYAHFHENLTKLAEVGYPSHIRPPQIIPDQPLDH